MLSHSSRRHFLKTAIGAGTLAGVGDLSFLSALGSVTAAQAKLDPKVVRLDAGIEPIVRLLEETPGANLLEEVAARVRKGLSYRDVLAALLLAGIRNVAPRPHVGFNFHAVLVVNSAHLASLSSPDSDRWLPIFWALDYFKEMQAESNWRMGPVDEAHIPSARKARKAFAEAMDNWDESAADAAVAGLARNAGANELFELFCRYGARDFRAIGHKAIFVANSWRTLQCIGWHHAEPILRSLAFALVEHEGDNPAKRDAPADRPWRRNVQLAAKIRPQWEEGKASPKATEEMLAVLHQGSDQEASEKVVELLNHNVHPGSIWEGLLAGAAELVLRKPGIGTLHAVTTTNALRYAFEASSQDETRRLMLLQNAAFIPLFREGEGIGRRHMNNHSIDKLEPLELKQATQEESIAEIFADVSRNRMTAARKALFYLQKNGTGKDLIDAARVFVFLKGNNAHDYKFSSAVLEDCQHLSPSWRQRYLAASMFLLRGAGGADNPLVARTRAALKG